VRLLAATSIACALLLGTSGSGESAGAATNPVQRAVSASREPTNRCLFRAVFAALEELRGIQALCPTWLPAGVMPTYINASLAEYVVEFEPPGRLFPHVVFQLAQGDPPGGTTVVRGKQATIHFEPSRQPAGLHSGHYIIAFPGGAFQRGTYWVSIHQETSRSRTWNVQRALRIVRSLRAPG
jgi:hypothetical protein